MIAFVPSRYRILPACSYSHSLPSRASVILFVFCLFLSLRWVALYGRERSRANPHAHGEAHLGTSYRPRGVSNTETVLSLILSIRRPRLRRGLLQQRRIVPGCLKRRMLWGGVPSMAFPSHRYRGTPCQRSAGVWRPYLPPQSFLPVGIGEVTPATNSPPSNFVSLHSLSYLRVSGRRPCRYLGWRRPRRLTLASPLTSFRATPRALPLLRH